MGAWAAVGGALRVVWAEPASLRAGQSIVAGPGAPAAADAVLDAVEQVGNLLVAAPRRAPGFSIPVVTEGNA